LHRHSFAEIPWSAQPATGLLGRSVVEQNKQRDEKGPALN
jgi:hypothetical protein